MNTDPWHALLALVLLVLLQWVPGLALCRLLVRDAPPLARLAIAPAVSTGLLYGLAEAADRAGLPVVPVLPLVVLVVAAGALVAPLLRQWRALIWRTPPAVLVGWVVGTGIWALGIRHLTAVPPHNDGYNHGYFVARIAKFATLDPSTVIAHDVISGGKGANFYPMALHQQAALAVRLLHLDVGIAWTLTTLSVIVIAFPVGAYALARQLFPHNLNAARASAVVAALAPGATYSTSWWGGYPLASGMAMSAGVLAWMLAPHGRAGHVRRALVVALGLVGVAGAHTSEWPMVAIVAASCWLVRALSEGQVRVAARDAAIGALPFLLSIGLLLPVLSQLRGGLSERTYPAEIHGLPFGKTFLEVLVQFSFVPPSTPPAVWIAALVGITVAVRRAEARGWVLSWVVFGVLYVWLASFPSDLITRLTASWYSDRFRLGLALAFLAVPLIGLALAGPSGEGRAPSRNLLRVGSAALAMVLAATCAVDSIRAIHDNYGNYSLVRADQRAAFRYLAEHQRPGERVLNQHQDDSAWMYSLYGVAPVFAVKTNNFESSDWDEALYLSKHVAEAGANSRVDALLSRLHVRYVYVGDIVFPTEKADITPSSLESNRSFREVFSHGTAHVFEVGRS